ncbi:HWE histidine kinase domain-containing protein [Salinarimonas sp.]|uniref:HWE histidine kinase domain-containing protein n=1 Tax=Salinarimonas sp. TaxID=2766526 RepID=UPI0032D8C9B7
MSSTTEQTPTFGEADLTNCDREPIHVPGSVQPHGLLLALDPPTLAVAQAGGDGPGLVGFENAALLGRRLDEILGAGAAAQVLAHLAEAADTSRPALALHAAGVGGAPLDLAVHRSRGVPIVEIEPRGETTADPLTVVQGVVGRLQDTPTIDAFLGALAREVRAVTGYARVMIYRFAPDDSGEVVAEERKETLEPYLGLHYPATDIPKQARALYLRSWIRVIADARYAPAPLEPTLHPGTGEPLDMSFALLRSVSPLHLEYLANMGVAASMSLSLVVDGRLWGLVACHHDAPKRLAQGQRAACELLAQMISLQLGEKLARAESGERLRASAVHARLVEALSREKDLAAALVRGAPTLLDYVAADGAALCVGGRVFTLGRTPPQPAIEALCRWLGETLPDGVFSTDRLPALYPPAGAFAETASGILALSVSRTPRDYVLWFRPEIVRTVTWAGDPSKPVQVSSDGERRLSPRTSFAAWAETVRGCARPWSSDEIEAAQTLRASILEVVLRRIDEIAREREAARARQDVLIAELDHRVKNTLATIQSLVKYSAASAASLEAFTRTVQMRLHAMARTHDLLTRARWEGADLAQIVETESAPYGGRNRVRLDGPPAVLKPKTALSLSLAMHELATNAAKYGALSVSEGWVDVSWGVKPDCERLVLVWKERGGPRVEPPPRRGFGRTLLERSVAYEIDGRVTLDFAPEGLTCTAEIPVEQLVREPDDRDAPDAASPSAGEAARAAIAGRRVLVVEDQALIAMEVQDELEAAGLSVVGPVGRLDKALAAAENEAVDAALIDVDLDGERSWPVADLLARRGVPFAFTTGFQAQIVFPPRFVAATVLAKPYGDGALVRLVGELLAARPDA